MPVILFALAVVALLGGSLLLVILIARAPEMGPLRGRHAQRDAQTRSLDFVAAPLAAAAPRRPGSSSREVLPNIAPYLIVTATLEAASAILLEAALSFLGLGVQPPLPSWGLMIAEAKPYMFFSFWLIAIPGTALALLVLSINLLGDGLRDAISPEGRGLNQVLLEVEGLTVDIATGGGTLHAVRGVSLRRAPRRDAMPRRRVRLRQIDDSARDHGPSPDHRKRATPDACGSRAAISSATP